LIFESGGALGHEWTRDGFAELIRYVVLDECDMLLGGSFGKQIEQILEMLRTGDRQRAARRACEEIGVDLEAYWTLPRHLRKAAQLQGGKGLVEEGVEDFLKVSVNLQESSTWLRQYAFVAATIPSEGKETIGARIKRDYPEAIWLSSDGVHKLLNKVEFRWREVAGLDEKIDEIMVSHTCSVNSICFQFKRATVFPAGYYRGFGSKRKCRQNTCVCRQFKVRTIDCIKVVWDCKW
jgi:hypothetical protein